jgi:hypothetical protein
MWLEYKKTNWNIITEIHNNLWQTNTKTIQDTHKDEHINRQMQYKKQTIHR